MVIVYALDDAGVADCGRRICAASRARGTVALRFAGDTLTVIAAASWRRSGTGIALGAAVVAAGWSHGLLPRDSSRAWADQRPGAGTPHKSMIIARGVY